MNDFTIFRIQLPFMGAHLFYEGDGKVVVFDCNVHKFVFSLGSTIFKRK